MPGKIVIIGAGFAGVWSALSARRLLNLVNKGDAFDILVIAPEPVLVMRPRLYEANTSSLTFPLSSLFAKAGISFLSGTVNTIHTDTRTVEVRNAVGVETTIEYDRLVLAAGSSVARPQSIPGLRQHAFDIDSLDTASKLESHLDGLASLPPTKGRDTVVVCGAGFTGIELATELPKRLGQIDRPRVILVGDKDHVAPDFGSTTRATITEALEDLGVEVKIGSGIKAVDADSVTLTSGKRIETRTAIWTAGVRATTLTQQIPAPKDALARLHVDQYLRVPAIHGVFATGDTACALADGNSQYALMSCQHAVPLGRVSGHNAAADLLGEPLVEYNQAAYNCCLDLGAWGALVAGGWQRGNVIASGDIAKRVKCYINQTLIYPPEDVRDALGLADPVGTNSDQLFEQLFRAVQ